MKKSNKWRWKIRILPWNTDVLQMSSINLIIKKLLISIQSQKGQWRADNGVMLQQQQVMNTLI